jgi:hypothetical protein
MGFGGYGGFGPFGFEFGWLPMLFLLSKHKDEMDKEELAEKMR